MSEENFKFKEKWYVSNVFLGILLVVCSIIPFAAILGIPFLLVKSHQFKKQFETMYNDFSQKQISTDTELSERKQKIDELVLNLNNANGEIHRLKDLISPDAQKLEAIKTKVKELKNKADDLKKEISQLKEIKKELEYSKKQIEQSKKEKFVK